MTKCILVLSSIGLVLTLLLGIYDPSSPLMWLASTSEAFNVLRAALLIAIVCLMIADPPSNVYLRGFIGLLSATLTAWSLGAFYENHMLALDACLLLAVGVSSGITALERDPLAEEPEEDEEETLPPQVVKKHGKRKLAAA